MPPRRVNARGQGRTTEVADVSSVQRGAKVVKQRVRIGVHPLPAGCHAVYVQHARIAVIGAHLPALVQAALKVKLRALLADDAPEELVQAELRKIIAGPTAQDR